LNNISDKTNFNRKEKAISHAANILGRTFEVLNIYDAFWFSSCEDRFLHVIYWLGINRGDCKATINAVLLVQFKEND
jgi:hypothetical protein